MVADCRAQGPVLWIPHAVGAPFMTSVRVHGGGLSCARSGVVDSACRGGAIYDARPRSWWRIVGGEVRWCCAVRVFGRHKWRPYVFAAGWGGGGVFIVFAPFGCSGVINGALRFCGGMGLRWCLHCVCAVRVFGRHKWRPYVFCERDGNSCCPGCRSCRFECFSWRCACPWMRCGGCFSVAVWKNCRFENNFHWKLC